LGYYTIFLIRTVILGITKVFHSPINAQVIVLKKQYLNLR